MSTLQTLLKSLKVRTFWSITLLAYVLTLIFIAYIVYQPYNLGFDVNDVQERSVGFFDVFNPNILIIIKNLIFGILTLGVYPFMSVVQNVVSIGTIGNAFILEQQVSLFYKMIPHGIFEIFGIVLSFTAVLYCFVTSVKMFPQIVKKKVRIGDVIEPLLRFLAAILIIELGVFTLAAIIEVVVSWTRVG